MFSSRILMMPRWHHWSTLNSSLDGVNMTTKYVTLSIKAWLWIMIIIIKSDKSVGWKVHRNIRALHLVFFICLLVALMPKYQVRGQTKWSTNYRFHHSPTASSTFKVFLITEIYIYQRLYLCSISNLYKRGYVVDRMALYYKRSKF